MKATLARVETLTHDIKTFWFKPEYRFRYTAGQFTELYLPHPATDKRGDKRWFTLSSSPTDELISITTRYANTHSSTFKQTLFTLPRGAEVHIAEAMGDFVLPKTKTIPLVFVAGGIGITPIHSMVKSLADTGEQRNITLLHAVNQPSDLLFADLFRAYAKDAYVPIVQHPAEDWRGESGMVTAAHILAVCPSAEALIYISGPEPMAEALVMSLADIGIDKQHIITDFFPGYTTF